MCGWGLGQGHAVLGLETYPWAATQSRPRGDPSDSQSRNSQRPYSVSARFIGQQARVLLRGNELLVFERRKIVARHPRLTRAKTTATISITTWRACRSSPGPWPDRPHWPPLARKAPTPRPRDGLRGSPRRPRPGRGNG
ncbi:Mu transposase domain-containing protein [Streptomyces spororaveus]|uniref:Mu transposase domain-containing protein n=1 Tax=Streptomyces TaxID=1883 RepID=UPI0035579765